MLLKDKICIVTGAGGGIGSAICKELLMEGASKVVATEHTSGTVEIWRRDCDRGFLVQSIVCDITNSNDIKELVKYVKKEFKRIDILVNAAGVEYNENIGMMDMLHVKEIFSTNVIGLIELTQYVSRIMMRQAGGAIVNIASVVGEYGNPGQSVYSASKGAVIAFTKSAAKELAKYGIRVNAVSPGLTDTAMISKISKEELCKRIDRISLKKMAMPDDIAKAVVFLASDNSSHITGEVLGVNGGTIM